MLVQEYLVLRKKRPIETNMNAIIVPAETNWNKKLNGRTELTIITIIVIKITEFLGCLL